MGYYLFDMEKEDSEFGEDSVTIFTFSKDTDRYGHSDWEYSLYLYPEMTAKEVIKNLKEMIYELEQEEINA